jgi:LuxR family maltose regulon positive regulatory protein
MVVVDEEGFRALPSAIAMYRAGQALIRGDVAGTMTHARRASTSSLRTTISGGEGQRPSDSRIGRAGTSMPRTVGMPMAWRAWKGAGHLSDVVGCAMALADIRIAQGRLHEAMSTYERGLKRVSEQAAQVLRGAADMHVGMSELFRERNDLDAALQHLRTSRELGEQAGQPQNAYRWRVAMARIREAQGDLGGALDLLDDTKSIYTKLGVNDRRAAVRRAEELGL